MTKISEFIDKEIREYSISVIESRAIPSIIDGFKPVQRKIIFTADKIAKSYIKTAALVGSTINIGGYYMGDASIESAIGKMTQSFTGSNNVSFLDGEGAFGSRLVPEGIAAARYTKSKISNNFYKLFKDFELLEYTEQDGELFEPNYYLPVLPTVLLNKNSGIAVGFACEIQPYKIKDIIENIKLILDGKKPKKMLPHYEGFKGKIYHQDDEIIMCGNWRQTDSTHIEISELPVGISREKYVEHLIKLQEKDIIRKFTDFSKKEFLFVVEMSRSTLKHEIEKNNIENLFKLTCRLTQNLNLISEDKKLLQFKDPNEIISYFVNFKLRLMSKRKKYWISHLSSEIDSIKNKIRFIEFLLHNKISLNEHKTKKSLIDKLTSENFKNINSIIETPVYNINEEHIELLNKKIKELSDNMEFYKNTDEKSLYMGELKSI